jgi:hypothetical protein
MGQGKNMSKPPSRGKDELPYVPKARSVDDAFAKIKRGMRAWARETSANVYKWGEWLDYAKQKLVPRGEFEARCIKEGLKPRTACNWHAYWLERKATGKFFDYHPNRWYWHKKKTVAALEPPEGSEPEDRIAHTREPRRPEDREPMVLSASEVGGQAAELIVRKSRGRGADFIREALESANEFVNAAIEETEENQS